MNVGLLFHRVILMSGSSLSPWALVREPSVYARQVAEAANCSFQLPHHILLKCLRDRPLEVLVNISVQVADFNTAFGPNVDGVIIDIVLSDNRKSIFAGKWNEYLFSLITTNSNICIDCSYLFFILMFLTEE